MAAERAQNLQDTFLNYVRKNKVPLTIFLVNGVKLQGVVTWFDNFCVLLRRDGHSQLVYKHAISTIMPGQPIQMFEPGEEAAAAKDSNLSRRRQTEACLRSQADGCTETEDDRRQRPTRAIVIGPYLLADAAKRRRAAARSPRGAPRRSGRVWRGRSISTCGARSRFV